MLLQSRIATCNVLRDNQADDSLAFEEHQLSKLLSNINTSTFVCVFLSKMVEPYFAIALDYPLDQGEDMIVIDSSFKHVTVKLFENRPVTDSHQH